ncbi:MAG: response regulator transcription factor [Acidobacteriota bacterium]|nr:response regulator transcription factor [Acidobacteriota bacterium]
MNLLIVEDNCRMREMIRSVVADIADELHECDDGADALAAYARHRPDWVLMDIKMKEMSGITATREIIASFPEAHVMIISNYDDMEVREAAREAGACGYTVKDDLMSLCPLLAGAKNSPPKVESH